MIQYQLYSEDENKSGLARRGSKQVNMLFDGTLARHLLNTFRALAFILTAYDDIGVYLNRCGSKPLEHRFGVLRVRAGYNHTIQHALRRLAMKQICGNMKDVKIEKRTERPWIRTEEIKSDE